MNLIRLRRRENLKNWEFSNVETIPTTLDAWTSNEMQKLKTSKANRWKKIFFWILIASALFAIVYFLPNIYDTGIDPIKIYQNYTTYIIFLYVSIILIYICVTTHSCFSRIMMTMLLLVNFFRLASFFTQDILGINTIEFYALTILFLLALAVTYIRYRVRYPLIVLIGIPFIIILLNHALPLYTDKPDFQWFYDSQPTTLNIQTTDDEKILQEAETKITIQNPTKEKTLELRQTPWEQTDLSSEFLSDNLLTSSGESSVIIQFSSKTGIQNTYAYINFPQGSIITLYPQSAIEIKKLLPTTLETEGNPAQLGKGGSQNGGDLLTSLNIIQWKINAYTPQDQSWYLTLTWDLTKMILDDTGDIQNIIDGFIARRNIYFINQIWWEIMLNPTIDAFIWRYLSVANSANKILQNLSNYSFIDIPIPSFNQNILNYDEFHTYLDYGIHTTYEAITWSTQRIQRDTQKGWDTTNTKARRDAIKNIFK